MDIIINRNYRIIYKYACFNIDKISRSLLFKSTQFVRRFSDGSSALPTVVEEACSVNPCNPEPSIVIVGAGIAGLSAAARLTQCGIRKFIVLEATERPGGRIHSCWLGDVVAELGAQWIYGACLPNTVYTLASQENLIKPPLHRYDPTKALYCTSEGRAVELAVSITAYHTFRQIEQQAASLYRLGCVNNGTLLNFLAVRIQQELHNFPECQRYDAARVMFGLCNMLKNRCGDDLSLVSADQYGSYVEMPGGSVLVPPGFVGVLAPLLRLIPNNAIRYEKAVKKIKWGPKATCGSRTNVVCCDNTVFPADYVIVTVSLGCLKCHADKLFYPVLPNTKMAAIENLGYGLCDKIFLEYCTPFWVPGGGGLKLAWSADELRVRGDWLRGVCSFDELPGSSHVLCASISGEEAAQMELLPEREVVEGITKLLRKFTGNPCLPYPSAMMRSAWASDPHFCGSISYMGNDSTVDMQCELGAPIPDTCESEPPSILFAGEATAPGHFATVHGARISGVREAERIVQLTNKFGGPPR